MRKIIVLTCIMPVFTSVAIETNELDQWLNSNIKTHVWNLDTNFKSEIIDDSLEIKYFANDPRAISLPKTHPKSGFALRLCKNILEDFNKEQKSKIPSKFINKSSNIVWSVIYSGVRKETFKTYGDKDDEGYTHYTVKCSINHKDIDYKGNYHMDIYPKINFKLNNSWDFY